LMAFFAFATDFGEVRGRVFGEAAEDNFVLCVQGKSANVDVITEWESTAKALAAEGWCVILPDLHTNERTKPGSIEPHDVAKVLQAALDHHKVVHPISLLGKSWGGGQATRFAASHRSQVSKLVLVAPSLDDAAVPAQLPPLPVRLFWAEDDTVVPVARASIYSESLDASGCLEFTTVAVGGHRILDEYIAPIISFLRGS